jgi:hypothetical protein
LVTRKDRELVAVPPAVVTTIEPVRAPVGTVAVSEVFETTVNVAVVPPNVTLVAPVKLEPVIVTFVPTGPLVGVKDEIVGAGGGVTETVKAFALVAVPPGVVTAINPVTAPAGTVALTEVPEMIVNDALVPPNVTLVAPVKLLPVIVTLVPTGPLVGVKDEMVGAGTVTVNAVALVAVPPGVVTAIGPVVAPPGTVAWRAVSETTVNDALVPPKLTLVVPVKLVPPIVTFTPTGPLVGAKDEIVGAGGVTLNAVALVAVPPGAVTAIVPVDAPVGTVVVSDVSETTVNDALVPPNFTLVVPVKLVPVIVTAVPTGPLVGLKDVIVGTGGGVVDPGVTPKSHVRHDVEAVVPPATAY